MRNNIIKSFLTILKIQRIPQEDPSSPFHICTQTSIHIHPMLTLGWELMTRTWQIQCNQRSSLMRGGSFCIQFHRSPSLKESKQTPSCWLAITPTLSHNLIISLTYEAPGVIKTTASVMQPISSVCVCGAEDWPHSPPGQHRLHTPAPWAHCPAQAPWAENAFNSFSFTFHRIMQLLEDLKIVHCNSFC